MIRQRLLRVRDEEVLDADVGDGERDRGLDEARAGREDRERGERQRDRMREREGAHHADERAQAAAHQDEAQQEDQVIGAGEDVLDAELQHRPGHGDRALDVELAPSRFQVACARSSTLTCALPARKRRAMWRCPGGQRVEHRHGQREPPGNLGADVADLEDDAALGLERPRAVERSGAGLGVGAHGQASGERARDGVVARGQLVGVDRPVVVGVERGQPAGQLAAGHPEVAVEHLAVEAVLAARDADRVGEGEALGRERGEAERGQQEDRGAAERSRLRSAPRHREGHHLSAAAIARQERWRPPLPPTHTARRSASPGRPRPRRSPRRSAAVARPRAGCRRGRRC